MSFIIKNEEPDDNKNKKDANEVENIKELGNYPPAPFTSDIFTMTIIGQIEGHTVLPPQTKSTKYEHIFPQLVNVEENPNIKGLLVILNTVGGDVEAGLAIAEMINSITKPTVSLVVGGGHSIGVPLAVATDYSFISPTATMIIHPIRMNGLVIGVPQTFAYFQKMQDRILSFITRNSKVSKEKLRELMLETDELLNDMGTILIGNQAVELGLIDEVGGIGEAYKKLRDMVDRANA
ncbi:MULTISPECIES: ClpP family protease [Caloramator]|uniref:ATP-dependent protease ClpP, protease subunit n=1 Tax=Caloramator proteoclasticus DSM 10124 TaxID=1121262 RepID=A0A1M4SNF0_9CLOT|nr:MULTISPECIES: ATP-dependent Clp protease proteolytic subunit [Caloramator]SHE33763.1 ATP-dependent protease ClpP, protease subunit [Caloramator proteoclasticus DSM 10124]